MNLSVQEFEMLRPRLRSELHFSVQEQDGDRVCVIEDPAASRFFRVGVEEYHFFRSLDGTQTVAAIIARLARDRSGETFTEQEALQMLRWLQDNQLLAVESGRKSGETMETKRSWSRAMKWINPLLIQIPLGRPDRLFTRLARLFRPFLGWFGFAIWLAVVVAGASHIGMEWKRFSQGFGGIIARDNWLWLGVAWAGLKVLHECGHGIYCRHFAARVREWGVFLILFVPMGYVDATSSLGIASKWRRIVVSCAGMYVEFFVAAIAAILWASQPDGPAATVLHNTVVMGTMVTFFFNANPLMRFDGYYILSDFLGIPNLTSRAKTWFTRAASWMLLGAERLRPEPRESARDWFVSIYAVLAWAWQLFVFAGLLLAASVMFRGGGLLFAAIAACAWVATPVWTFGRQLADWMRQGLGGSLDVALRVAVIAGLVVLVFFSPYRKTVVAQGVVEFGDTRLVRAECPGFVARINVRNGDVVAAGAVLIELRNEEVASVLAKARRELAAQELRARIAYVRGEVAEYQAEMARADGLRKTVIENESYLATMKIRAPIAGRVTLRNLDLIEETYFRTGDEILRLGEERGREVKVAVSQAAEPHFKAALRRLMHVRVEGRGDILTGRLVQIDDSASRALPHPALTALAGGPLPVQPVEDADGASRGGARHELAEPHFGATVRMVSEGATALNDGEIVRLKFRSSGKVTLWKEARGAIERWMRKYGA